MSNVSSGNQLHGIRSSGIVSVWLDGAATLSNSVGAWESRQVATIPSGFRPQASLCVPLVSDYGVGMAKLDPDGSVAVLARGSSLNGNVTFATTYDAGE